jgi:hypothetical protein
METQKNMVQSGKRPEQGPWIQGEHCGLDYSLSLDYNSFGLVFKSIKTYQ